MSKTIFITSFHSLISRNILATNILNLLVEKGYRIVILVPKIKEEYFLRKFTKNGIVIKGVDFEFGLREKILKYLSLSALNTTSLKIKRNTEMNGSGAFLSKVISNRVGVAIIRFIEKVTYQHTIFQDLFAEYKPVTVFSTDIQSELDVALLNEAKRRSIKAIGMVRSWDNLTSKGLMRSVPDVLLVWNYIVMQEAIQFHYIKKDSITVIGIPHYDDYTTYTYSSKEDFCKKVGANPLKKIVLVIPIGDRYIRNNCVDRDVVDILDKELSDEYQILVRLPPGDYVRELETKKDIWKNNRVVFDRSSTPFSNIKISELSKEDDIHLANTIKWSDIVVAGPSTAVIDAVYMDKPVILFAFDGYEEREYLDSIRRYYDYDNFVHIVKSGGVVLAQSIDVFKQALREPNKNLEGRKRLVKEQVVYTDGTATARLLKELIQ